MKIQDAKKAYAAQMDTLWTRKRDLSQALKNCQQGGAPNVDRVEISRELSAVDAQYNEAQGVMESIIERETAIHNAEVAKQQGNALSKAAEEMGKMLEIYHRIASGGQVPPEDEQRLMEYNHELYMAAKTAAMLQEGDGEKYDSLFEDEEEKNGEEKTASEIAGEAEISVPGGGGSRHRLGVMAIPLLRFFFRTAKKAQNRPLRFCAPLSYLRDSLRFGRLHLRWSGAAARPFRSVVRNRSFCLGASAFPFGIA